MNRDYVLSRIDIKSKDKLFKKMRVERDKLSDELYYCTSNDSRNKIIKNLKIYKETVKTIIPYLLSASVIFGTCSIISVPFVRDVKVSDMNMVDAQDNFILYITSKSYSLNGSVVSDVYKYVVDCSFNDIDALLDGNYDDFNCRLLSKEVVDSDNITKDRYVVYYNDKVYSYESEFSNGMLSILYVLLTILGEIYSYRLISSSDKYRNLEYRINEINYDYDNPDVNLLKKRLKISDDNYKYLMRK